MIVIIPAILLKYKKFFSNAGYLIILLQNWLKEDIIEAFKYLNI